MSRSRRSGLSLVEVLVVLAIVGISIGLFLPSVRRVREAATRAKCQSMMKQLGLAVHNYASTYGDRLPPAYSRETVEHGTAWIHKLAHREDSRALSPGTVLSAALFERVIDGDGVELIDFGTGDDGDKRDWMDDVRTRWRIDALDPRSPRAWPGLARDLARDLAARLKRR